jgi:hypothetical protein
MHKQSIYILLPSLKPECLLFNNAVSNSGSKHQIIGYLSAMNWKGRENKPLWSNLRDLHQHVLETKKKHEKPTPG